MQLNDSDRYLLKLKGAGLSDFHIAQRMGMKEEQVRERMDTIIGTVSAATENGYVHVCNAFETLVSQYSSLGSSLKSISKTLSNTATEEEITLLLSTLNGETNEERARKLMKSFIILRPYVPPTPEESVDTELGTNRN